MNTLINNTSINNEYSLAGLNQFNSYQQQQEILANSIAPLSEHLLPPPPFDQFYNLPSIEHHSNDIFKIEMNPTLVQPLHELLKTEMLHQHEFEEEQRKQQFLIYNNNQNFNNNEQSYDFNYNSSASTSSSSSYSTSPPNYSSLNNKRFKHQEQVAAINSSSDIFDVTPLSNLPSKIF